MLHYTLDSANAEYLRLMADIEHDDPDDTPTCRLPVICPEAYEVARMTDEEVRRALADEFGEAA